jgi:PAS domain S-box-containing protein
MFPFPTHIRTKIIGGYLLFTLLIGAFLGANYLLVSSTVHKTTDVYEASEWIRIEMETENAFWRQVISMTDYFLDGDPTKLAEFHRHETSILQQLARLESSLRDPREKEAFSRLRTKYREYTLQFESAAKLYRQGRKMEAKQWDLDLVDPAEEGVEVAFEDLVSLKRAQISESMVQVRSYHRYAAVLPSLDLMIQNTEVIYTENVAMQHSLEAEESFLKQVVALTDLFVFDSLEHVQEFNELGQLFRRELASGVPYAKGADERTVLQLIQTKHEGFTATFAESVAAYRLGQKERALQVEITKVDPAEEEMTEALAQFYPMKERNMRRALDNVLLIDMTAISITKNLGICILLTLILGLALGTINAIRITRPITRLVEATGKITRGDFGVRLTEAGRDEVGTLARSFNRMAQTLQGTTVSKEYVDGIIRSMNDSLIVTSADGRIVTANEATGRMLGYTDTDLLGEPLARIFDAAGAPELVAAEGLTVNDLERVCRTQDGRQIPVSVSSARLRLDSRQAEGTVYVVKNITARKEAEKALRESQYKLSLHIQQTPLAVIEWNLQAEIVEWNPAAESMFGYSREEAIGSHITGLLLPETERERAEQDWQQFLTQRTSQHRISENVTKDSRTIICEWYNTPLDDAGIVFGVASMVQDATARIQMKNELEQARDTAIESARLKSEFLANMSHEIRTPMNGVIGMTGLLLDTELTDAQHEFAETIRESGDALLTIINDILDFSKIEAGKLQFESLDFNLTNAVEGTVELLAERARASGIEFASLIYHDVPVELRGDPGRLRQVLTNLIGNALKFTEAGEVVVRAEKELETADHVVIRFSVTDTGIGISESARKQLFEAFTQADGSTTRKYGGTGLGLAISKQLVQLMDGEIGVESELGQGSKFWFTARFEKQPAGVTVSSQVDSSRLAGLRALIVDDNATNRKIIAHQLAAWGVISQEADCAATALVGLRESAAQGSPFDLTIIDFMMPEMNGLQLAQAITQDPLIAGTRRVMLTSAGPRIADQTAKDAGISVWLSKPVRQAQLAECLVLAHTGASSKHGAQATKGARSTSSPVVPTAEKPVAVTPRLILLAEDNIVNQKVAVLQLSKLGHRTDAVANGREAIEALERITYDLVLMDCQMPEMDGYEATREIRAREGGRRRIPIVAMTANALQSDRDKCLAAGMDDYISKPVKVGELEIVLQRLLPTEGIRPEKPRPSPATSSSPPPVEANRSRNRLAR